MGDVVEKVSIEHVLRGIGVTAVETVDPLNYKLAVETVRKTADLPGVKAIIFRSPCVALFKPQSRVSVAEDACVGCKKCIREIGCPALSFSEGKVRVDAGQCTGCGLCAGLCPAGAITGGERHA